MKYFFAAILVLFIISCSIPSDFGIPSWKTRVHLKVFNDEYTVEDLAAEDSTLFVQDDVLIFDKTMSESQSIGEFTIDDPEAKHTQYYLYELAPDSIHIEDFQGTTIPFLPSLTLVPLKKELEPYSEFEEITFASGDVSITVTNNTCIWLGNAENGERLKLSIVNFVSDEEIISFFADEDIAPNGGSQVITGSIANVTFPNTLKLQLTGGSRGSDGEPTVIDTMATINVTVQLSNIKASYVKNARIPKQPLDEIIGNYQTNFEYPEIHGDFELLGFRKIELNFFSPVPATFNIVLTAVNSTDLTSVQLLPNDADSLFFEIPHGNTSVVLSSDLYNLNEFVSILPDSFAYEMFPIIGDTTQVFDLDFDNDIDIDIRIFFQFQFPDGLDS